MSKDTRKNQDASSETSQSGETQKAASSASSAKRSRRKSTGRKSSKKAAPKASKKSSSSSTKSARGKAGGSSKNAGGSTKKKDKAAASAGQSVSDAAIAKSESAAMAPASKPDAPRDKKTPRVVGIIRGMETTFPDGLVHHINEYHSSEGVRAEFVELDAVRMDGEARYAAILDRISHEVPFFRSYLKWASLKGTYVVNNPFWWSADDKFIDNVIAEAVDVAVPRTVILPHKERMPNTQETTYRNVRYPLDWDATFAYIGFPAFMKPHDGGGWRGVSKVRNADELFAAYDASGTDCMMLQESIEYEDYFRCYGVGREHVRIMRYNPAAESVERYFDVPDSPVDPKLLATMERGVLALCSALGYDLNTVEFAVRDGIPYAIDFMNPAPDADYHSVGLENYEWVIKTMAEFLVRMAVQPPRRKQFSANGALED